MGGARRWPARESGRKRSSEGRGDVRLNEASERGWKVRVRWTFGPSTEDVVRLRNSDSLIDNEVLTLTVHDEQQGVRHAYRHHSRPEQPSSALMAGPPTNQRDPVRTLLPYSRREIVFILYAKETV